MLLNYNSVKSRWSWSSIQQASGVGRRPLPMVVRNFLRLFENWFFKASIIKRQNYLLWESFVVKTSNKIEPTLDRAPARPIFANKWTHVSEVFDIFRALYSKSHTYCTLRSHALPFEWRSMTDTEASRHSSARIHQQKPVHMVQQTSIATKIVKLIAEVGATSMPPSSGALGATPSWTEVMTNCDMIAGLKHLTSKLYEKQ